MLRRLLREGRRFPSTVRVSMLGAALGATAGLVTAQDDERGPRFEGLKRLDLPPEIVRAADVRWLADGEIVLGVIGPGIHAWRIGESGAQLRVALEEPADDVREEDGRVVITRNPFERDYGRLAVSPQGIAFSDLFAGIHVTNEDGISGAVAIEFLGDLDRRGSLTAAVGLMPGDADGWAPYAAWLIPDGGGSPRGLLPTRDGGRGLELCRDAELSVIRFIPDGRLIVIPGAEAGVFVYDVDGALQDSLDAATFFAESGCRFELDQWGSSPLSDAYQRADWLGPRRIIDEVVADGAGNVYFFVRYGAERPAEEPGAEVGSLRDFGPRAVTADITATLPNTDPACPTPHCYEPATPGGLVPATSAYRWRPAPGWRAEGSRRRPSIHHVALRSGPRAEGLTGQPHGLQASRQQQPQPQPQGRNNHQWSRQDINRIRTGRVEDLVAASVPPPRGRVCWDLVHAHVDDLRTVARQPCVLESEFADTRLRADLLGDRAVILFRGGAVRGADVRAAEAFEARLLPPAGSGD
ncbi:MAG: hypothetical protein F4210_00770 [Holophagales bacterium]|nr:hypothetical protein [Holophagales bacterium]MYF94048.1 hypothetical protein [Holophagales bacterium]